MRIKQCLIEMILIFLIWILTGSQVSAKLELKTVYPTLGITEQDYQAELRGTGFDEDTRVSMFLDAANKKAIIGSTDIPGDAMGITIVDHIAYVADRLNGLQIIDISNLSNPVQIGTLDTSGVARRVVAADQTVNGETKRIAYLAGGVMGLQIIDVTDPSHPVLMSSLDTVSSSSTGVQNNALDLAVADNRVYLANALDFLIIDVSDPYKPEILFTIDEKYDDWYNEYDLSWSVAIAGNRVYVGIAYTDPRVNRGKVLIIDVSNPEYLRFDGSVNVPDFPLKIAVENSILYVACQNAGLQIIDVSEPGYARTLGFLYLQSSCRSLTPAPASDRVFVSTQKGLYVIDVKDPSHPKEIGAIGTSDTAEDMVLTDNVAYLAARSAGLLFIDTDSVLSPVTMASALTKRLPRDVTVKGKAAYIRTDEGLQIMDITDPMNPVSADPPILAAFSGIPVCKIAFSENKAYGISDTRLLQIFDVSNPLSPRAEGSVMLPVSGSDIAVQGNTAYIAAGDAGLLIADIQNPAAPVVKKTMPVQGKAAAVAAEENRVYLAVAKNEGGHEIQILKADDSSDLTQISFIATKGSNAVEVRGDRVYVLHRDGFQIIDVSEPSAPYIAGAVELPAKQTYFTRDFDVVGKTVYLTYHTLNGEQLQVTDMTNPAHPIEIASFIIPGEGMGIAVSDNTAYIACGWNWKLAVIPMPLEIKPDDPVTATRMSVKLPGPKMPAHYTLKVYNKSEIHDLPGAVTFVLPEKSYIADTKAIIVAGRVSSQNSLWDKTLTCTNHAYNVLLRQGYTRESIYYLNPEDVDADGDGLLNDVDDKTIKSSLFKALEWAKNSKPPAYELLLYMTGHGGNEEFLLNGDEAEEERKIEASALKGCLDDLQETMTGKVIVIYDACYSGSFLQAIKPDKAYKKRILITSTDVNENAYFLSSTGIDNDKGKLSFSFQFWSGIFYGLELREAFFVGKDIMSEINQITHQNAFLDYDGDGIGNEEQDDYTAADRIVIRRGYRSVMNMPVIEEICGEQLLADGNSARIWVRTRSSGIRKVTALITPPCYNPPPGTAITELPSIELCDADNDGVFESVYNEFTIKGSYTFAVYAEDAEGLCSLPKKTAVVREQGMPCPKGDINGDTLVTLADIIAALKVTSGDAGQVRTDYAASGVDMNGDGKAGLEDAICILEKLAEW